MRRFLNQSDQPIQRIFPVSGLAAKSAGINHQRTVSRHPMPGYLYQPPADIRRQVWIWGHRKTQLYGRGGFIYMLAAGPRSTNKRPSNVVFVDGYCWRDLNHLLTVYNLLIRLSIPASRRSICPTLGASPLPGAWGVASGWGNCSGACISSGVEIGVSRVKCSSVPPISVGAPDTRTSSTDPWPMARPVPPGTARSVAGPVGPAIATRARKQLTTGRRIGDRMDIV